VQLPAEPKPLVPMAELKRASAGRLRELTPDGSFGGSYQRPDFDVLAVWDAGVAEVRELLETGWSDRA